MNKPKIVEIAISTQLPFDLQVLRIKNYCA
jgi:hypothetical protein